MKIISKIFLIISILVLFSGGIFQGYAYEENLSTGNKERESTSVKQNKHLNNIKDTTGETDFRTGRGGVQGIENFLVSAGKSAKNIFFFLAGLYFLILIIRLLFSENSDEAATNAKKGFIWITIGLIVMQSAYAMVRLLYDKGVGQTTAFNFIDKFINPLIALLETATSLFFIAICIIAFYKIIVANGDEEKIKSGKMSVLYGIVGFVIVKVAKGIVASTYGTIHCQDKALGIFEIVGSNCIQKANLTETTKIIIDIINWANSLVGIVVVIMIIYAGAQVILSFGDEEKLKKAKMSILYIAIGLFILFANYLILTFFLVPETTI